MLSTTISTAATLIPSPLFGLRAQRSFSPRSDALLRRSRPSNRRTNCQTRSTRHWGTYELLAERYQTYDTMWGGGDAAFHVPEAPRVITPRLPGPAHRSFKWAEGTRNLR